VRWESLPQVGLSLAGISSRKPGSDPTSLRGKGRGFVVDKVGPGLLLRIIWVSTVSTIPPIFHTHTFHSPKADVIRCIILTTGSVVEHMNIVCLF